MEEKKELLQRFVEWAKIKVRIHLTKREIYFREGEIWWASLGANIGHEQDGKNTYFERPVVVLKKFGRHTLWVIPLTSQIKDGPYYHHYSYGTKRYSALLTQLRLISSKRLLRKIGIIGKEEYHAIKEKVKDLL